jgi:hypothetical protein
MMIPAGYMRKKVRARPEGLQAAGVVDVYSVSSHVSEDFADYIDLWKHNAHWLFDSPEILLEAARAKGADISETRLFYYEIYEREYHEEDRAWRDYVSDWSLATDVRVPGERKLEGYDVASFWARTGAECSPLSCNALALEIPVNEHCLLGSLETAISLLEQGRFEHSEPGPFRIFAVYSVPAAMED